MSNAVTSDRDRIYFIANKMHIIIPIIFLIFTGFVGFVIDNPSHDSDLLYYYFAGNEILYGQKENVVVSNAPVGWPILLASLNSIINDVFVTASIFSVLSATGIVFLSYYIIKEVFGWKIALLTQTLVAINPFMHSEAIITHNEMLPVFLIFAALYFITKKQLLYHHITCAAILLGLSFMLRYQSFLVAIGVMVFLLITIKRNSKSFPALFLVIFLLSISPLLLYNLDNTGNLIDSSISHYAADKIPELEDAAANQWRNTSDSQLFQIQIPLENYLHNLFIQNPHKILNLGLGCGEFFETCRWDSFSSVPLIPYIGIPLVLGGAIYVFNSNFTKKQLVSIASISLALITLLVILNKFEYFFVAISLPVVILGIFSFKKIEKNVLVLLIILLGFLLLISIIPVSGPWDMFSILLIPSALTAIFILKSIPKIISKIGGSHNHKTARIIKTYLVISISIIIISNISFSIMVEKMLLFDENMDYKNILDTEKLEKIGSKFKNVGDILSKEPNIQNKYIIASDFTYAYFAGSKMIFSTFSEGNENDSFSSFLTRENWSEYEKILSDAASIPRDRYSEYNPTPDYIVYDKRLIKSDRMEILLETDNPNIPSNFELLYTSNEVVVYKINNTK